MIQFSLFFWIMQKDSRSSKILALMLKLKSALSILWYLYALCYNCVCAITNHLLTIHVMYSPSGITTPPPIGTFTTAGTDVLDMPVDPNEPTYCLCHQVCFFLSVICIYLSVSVCVICIIYLCWFCWVRFLSKIAFLNSMKSQCTPHANFYPSQRNASTISHI